MENEIRNLIIAALQTRKYDDIVEKYAEEHLEMVTYDDIAGMVRSGNLKYELEYAFDDWAQEYGYVSKEDISHYISIGDYDKAIEDRVNELNDNKDIKAHLSQREILLDKLHQEMHPDSVLSYKYCGQAPCHTWDALL